MRTVPIPENKLLDYLIDHLGVKNNRALAEFLGVTQSAISKIRYGINKPSADFILTVYDKTSLSIEDIRALIGEEENHNGSDTGKES